MYAPDKIYNIERIRKRKWMTQSPVPLIESNLTFSWKPGKVGFLGKQKAERLGRMQSWWREDWQGRGCGWRVGGRSLAKHQSCCQWSEQLPALNGSELHFLVFHTLAMRVLRYLFSLYYTPRLYLSSLNLKVTNSTWFVLTLFKKFQFIQ